ncbi:Protection of telomeres protein 1 [Escovopsis weberi]|uniref:Protection of telomeres protein 1 n=1 Tax=Escovopsis weberi TaxID=150374 RepID=A0A0M8N2K5_ESCWE|nr:Protection of telomeres protein 1 [Escovopsis weberi]
MPAPTRARAPIELPAKFRPIRDLLGGDARMGTLVNIIGVVTDFRTPVATRGTALKRQARKTFQPKPEPSDHAFVSTFHHSIQKLKMPTETEFENRKLRSAMYAPGKKFKELREISDHAFVDVIVEIVKDPWAQGDICTLWVSDYTEHGDFFNFAFKGLRGNPNGHDVSLDTVDHQGSSWVGPDQEFKARDWIHLRNLQIKFGHNGANLEGFLREDRDSHGTKVQIARLDLQGDPSTIDPRLIAAITRKRDYEREKKAQIKSLIEAENQGRKRRSDVAENQEPKANAREKRRQKRAHLQQNQDKPPEQPDEARPEAGFLNHLVKYEHQDKTVSTITEILREPPPLPTTVEGEEVEVALPFRNVNYRANVRIVNFSPSRLEEFAFAKRFSEFDILRDGESSSDDDLEPLSQISLRWEWRFFLELEDATPENDSSKRRAAGGKRRTLWVAVDNSAAQCLVNLDASNLADDADALETLRQRMFYIWGELEEHKAQTLEEQRRAASGNAPPADSDEEEGQGQGQGQQGGFNNLPFGCCIKEYGFKVPEEDPLRADAGEGRRWQRAFALFGTKITH